MLYLPNVTNPSAKVVQLGPVAFAFFDKCDRGLEGVLEDFGKVLGVMGHRRATPTLSTRCGQSYRAQGRGTIILHIRLD
jgi:hypothetical protein